jgi:hypothetical protein
VTTAAHPKPQGEQIRPDHYADLIQPLDYEKLGLTPEEIRGFLRGNAMKCLMRYPKKGQVVDLFKARTYVDWLIEYETSQTFQAIKERNEQLGGEQQ